MNKDNKLRINHITRILFICLGNICRSPAAEGVLRSMVEERGLEDEIYIDSAGIGSWHVGEQPDRRMRKHAARRGYDLSALRARQFRPADFERFHWIVVMDDENYHDVMRQAPADFPQKKYAKVVRISDFFQRFQGYDSVPDPYYGGDEGFEVALDRIEDACRGLLSKLSENE